MAMTINHNCNADKIFIDFFSVAINISYNVDLQMTRTSFHVILLDCEHTLMKDVSADDNGNCYRGCKKRSEDPTGTNT